MLVSKPKVRTPVKSLSWIKCMLLFRLCDPKITWDINECGLSIAPCMYGDNEGTTRANLTACLGVPSGVERQAQYSLW